MSSQCDKAHSDVLTPRDTLWQRSGFPKEGGSSLSYWMRDVQSDPLLDHRTTPQLPLSADIAIIGSGMTGTLIAKHCLATWPHKSVVVLEARQFCSGATGRNAGHCKPDQYRGFTKYEQAFGPQQALKILENEQQTWRDLVQFVCENDVDCDLWVGDTLDVPVTLEAEELAKAAFDRFKAAGGVTDHIKVIDDPSEAAKMTRIQDARMCFAWPASTLQPWKLTAHIMRENLNNGVNLQTQTTVTDVRQSVKTSGGLVVKTDRGEIECLQVVHATNAYSSALEPSLYGIIRPSPHICNKVVPPMSYAGPKGLLHSYGVLLSNGAMFSINPRCHSDGMVLFGGDNPGQQKFNEWLKMHPERCVDDTLTGRPCVTESVHKFAESQFPEWSESGTGPGALYDHSWSGIIAFTADGIPFIGQLPGLPGQWVCAGHNGHGMARIFTAAPGLVKLMDGKPWEDTNLPDVFEITSERINRLRQ